MHRLWAQHDGYNLFAKCLEHNSGLAVGVQQCAIRQWNMLVLKGSAVWAVEANLGRQISGAEHSFGPWSHWVFRSQVPSTPLDPTAGLVCEYLISV
jgi:hypothetical protein